VNIGDVFLQRTLKIYSDKPKDERGLIWETWNTRDRKTFFVCLLLGHVQTGEQFDPEKMLNAMGWFRK
jgi:hypothetical protein